MSLDFAIVAAVFPAIFIAELPDKSMFASLVMASRGRPFMVWLGTAAAFAVHVVIAVSIGVGLFRVLPQDKWVKQILHVLSVDQANTDAIARVWPTIDPAIRADTIVLVTQTKGGGFVYCHPTPPLGSECQ